MSANIKRIFIISFVVVVSIACIWLAYRYKVSTNETVYQATITASSSPLVILGNAASDIDSDSDGLKDWEEVLWGSDRHNPDSDKDGMKDGDEVRLARNPLVKGPDDAISKYPMGTNTTSDPITATNKFSRDLFARYSALKGQTGTVESIAQQKLVEEVIAGAVSLVEKPPQYTTQSLSTIKTPTSSDIQTYTSNVRAILLKERGDTGNEIAILAEAVEYRNSSNLSKLDAISAYYTRTAKALLGIKVPQPIAQNHIAMTNAYFALSKNVSAFKYVLTDPFIGSINFSDYAKNNDILSEHLKTINTYVEQTGLSILN